jgi:two-component system, response regulator PdtaR
MPDAERARAVVSAPDGDPQPARTPSILIVDDEVLIRLSTSDLLRDAGFDVLEAASADDALSLLRAGVCVDLVFTDVRMPGSLNGIELARVVGTEWPHLRIVLTSSHLDQKDVASHVAAFVPKPYSADFVTRLINELLS